MGYLPFSSSFSSATGWTWPAGAGDGEGGASDPEVKGEGRRDFIIVWPLGGASPRLGPSTLACPLYMLNNFYKVMSHLRSPAFYH